MSMFIASAVWRRERASTIVLSACELLQTRLSDDQRVLVSQILFDALRTLLQALKEIGPLAASAGFVGSRTPLQDQEAFDYIDRAKNIGEQLLAQPSRCVEIMERICG